MKAGSNARAAVLTVPAIVSLHGNIGQRFVFVLYSFISRKQLMGDETNPSPQPTVSPYRGVGQLPFRRPRLG